MTNQHIYDLVSNWLSERECLKNYYKENPEGLILAFLASAEAKKLGINWNPCMFDMV